MAEKVTKIKLTLEGKKRYEAELNELKTVKRKEIAENLQSARAQGDLSENSEYDEAKNEQAKVEARILQLENMLKNVTILDSNELSSDVVQIGSKVKIKDLQDDEILEYRIVGSMETNPDEGKISDESPVGKGLLGHRVGEELKIKIPSGFVEYLILDISI